MSITNAMVGTAVGLALSASSCNFLINYANNHLIVYETVDDGQLISKPKYDPCKLATLANILVIVSGVGGFYYGYTKNKKN